MQLAHPCEYWDSLILLEFGLCGHFSETFCVHNSGFLSFLVCGHFLDLHSVPNITNTLCILLIIVWERITNDLMMLLSPFQLTVMKNVKHRKCENIVQWLLLSHSQQLLTFPVFPLSTFYLMKCLKVTGSASLCGSCKHLGKWTALF